MIVRVTAPGFCFLWPNPRLLNRKRKSGLSVISLRTHLIHLGAPGDPLYSAFFRSVRSSRKPLVNRVPTWSGKPGNTSTFSSSKNVRENLYLGKNLETSEKWNFTWKTQGKIQGKCPEKSGKRVKTLREKGFLPQLWSRKLQILNLFVFGLRMLKLVFLSRTFSFQSRKSCFFGAQSWVSALLVSRNPRWTIYVAGLTRRAWYVISRVYSESTVSTVWTEPTSSSRPSLVLFWKRRFVCHC